MLLCIYEDLTFRFQQPNQLLRLAKILFTNRRDRFKIVTGWLCFKPVKSAAPRPDMHAGF